MENRINLRKLKFSAKISLPVIILYILFFSQTGILLRHYLNGIISFYKGGTCENTHISENVCSFHVLAANYVARLYSLRKSNYNQ